MFKMIKYQSWDVFESVVIGNQLEYNCTQYLFVYDIHNDTLINGYEVSTATCITAAVTN